MTKFSFSALAGTCAAALMLTGCQSVDLGGAQEEAQAAQAPAQQTAQLPQNAEVCLIPYVKSEPLEQTLVQGFAEKGVKIRVLDSKTAKPGDCERTLVYGIAVNEKKATKEIALQGFVNEKQMLNGSLPPDEKGHIKAENMLNILVQAVVYLVNPQAAQQAAQQQAAQQPAK